MRLRITQINVTLSGTFNGNGGGLTNVNAAAIGGVAGSSLNNAYMTSWMSYHYLDWWSADTIQTNDGSAITNWIGRNGNALVGNCWYSASGVSGLPSTYWDGSGNNILTNGSILGGLSGPQVCTNAATIFVVFRVPASLRQPAPASPSIVFDGMLTNGSWNAFFAANYNFNGSFNEPPFFQSTYSGTPGVNGQDEANFHWTDDTRVFCVCWSNNVFQTFWDGAVFQNYPSGPTYGGTGAWNTPFGFMGTLSVGQLFNHFWPFAGYISEFLIYTNCLPDQTIAQINTYFLRKYNLYRNSIDLFMDSMGSGFATINDGFGDLVSSNFQNWSIRVQAVPGANSSGILSNIVTDAHMNISGDGKTIGVIWCNLNNDGTPPTNQYGADLGTITNNLITAARILTTNGVIPVLVNPPSNPWTDTNGERFAFQNWCTNCASQAGYAAIIDFSRSTHFGQYTQYINTLYYPVTGQPHWTNVTYTEANQSFVQPVLGSLINYAFFVNSTTAPPPTASQPWTAIDSRAPGAIFVNNNGTWQQK